MEHWLIVLPTIISFATVPSCTSTRIEVNSMHRIKEEKRSKVKCELPNSTVVAGENKHMPWVNSEEYWDFALRSCRSAMGKTGNSPLQMLPENLRMIASQFVPGMEYKASGVTVSDDANGRTSEAVAHTISSAAHIAREVLKSGVESLSHLISGLADVRMHAIGYDRVSCLQCVSSMMLQYPASQFAVTMTRSIRSSDGKGYQLCGITFPDEPSVLDITLQMLKITGYSVSRLSQAINSPTHLSTSSASVSATIKSAEREEIVVSNSLLVRDKKLNEQVAALLASVVEGGLLAVKAARFSATKHRLNLAGHRYAAETLLTACFRSEQELTNLRAWWHSTIVSGVVPGIQVVELSALTESVTWGDLMKNPSLSEKQLHITICPPSSFRVPLVPVDEIVNV